MCGSPLPPRTEAWFDDESGAVECQSCHRVVHTEPLAAGEIQGEAVVAPPAPAAVDPLPEPEATPSTTGAPSPSDPVADRPIRTDRPRIRDVARMPASGPVQRLVDAYPEVRPTDASAPPPREAAEGPDGEVEASGPAGRGAPIGSPTDAPQPDPTVEHEADVEGAGAGKAPSRPSADAFPEEAPAESTVEPVAEAVPPRSDTDGPQRAGAESTAGGDTADPVTGPPSAGAEVPSAPDRPDTGDVSGRSNTSEEPDQPDESSEVATPATPDDGAVASAAERSTSGRSGASSRSEEAAETDVAARSSGGDDENAETVEATETSASADNADATAEADEEAESAQAAEIDDPDDRSGDEGSDRVTGPGPLVAELPFADGGAPLAWKGDLFQGPPVSAPTRPQTVEKPSVSLKFTAVLGTLARNRAEPNDRIGTALRAAEDRGLIWMPGRRTPGGFVVDHLTVTPNGIWVIAAEPSPSGRVEKRDVGDWFTPEPRLFVGDDDHTHAIRRIESVDDSVRRAVRGTIAADIPRYKVISFVDSPPGWLDRPFPFDDVWVTWSHHLVEPMLSTVTYQRDEVAEMAEVLDKVLDSVR